MIIYIREYFVSGAVLLTGNKDRPLEARTLKNRVDRIFKENNIEAIPFQRYRKTWKLKKPDGSIFETAGGEIANDIPGQDELDKRWLVDEMKRDLKHLRLILGIGYDEMGDYLGISSSTYLKMEDGKRIIKWDEYLALLFFFSYNNKTREVLRALGLYPKALKESLKG